MNVYILSLHSNPPDPCAVPGLHANPSLWIKEDSKDAPGTGSCEADQGGIIWGQKYSNEYI